MAVRFITISGVREVSGVSVALVADADVTQIIEDVEYQTEKYMNSAFTPKIDIDVLDGNGKDIIFTRRAPLLALRSLESNDTSVSVANTDVKKSGQIRLVDNTETSIFTAVRRGVVIKYLYGRVEWDNLTETDSTAATTAGSSVAISVTDESSFTTNDFIEIFGTDKNKEVAQVTGTDTNEITVDVLGQAHVSGSLIRKMVLNPTMERLMKILAGLALVARVVGESFDDITGYSIGELQVQKGEPFTQWRETALQLQRQRDEILKSVRPTPGIV